jgi:hypothetical protein
LNGIDVLIPGYHSIGAPDTKLLFPGFQIGVREGATLIEIEIWNFPRHEIISATLGKICFIVQENMVSNLLRNTQ